MGGEDVKTFLEENWMSLVVAVVIAISGAVLTYFVSYPADLFRVLVISQASVLAIVVSVGLISVQVSANRFTPRIARLFQRDGFLNNVITLFGMSILVDIALIVLFNDVTHAIGRSLMAGTAFLFAAGSFLSIYRVKDEMLELMNPDPLLDNLVESLTLEDYVAYSEKLQDDGHTAQNPMLEPFQIAVAALKDEDNHTAIQAIDALRRANLKLVEAYGSLDEDERDSTAFRYQEWFDYWNRISDVAVEHGTQKTITQIVDALEEVSITSMEHDTNQIGSNACKSLLHLCRRCHAEQRLRKKCYHSFKNVIETGIDMDNMSVPRSAGIYTFILVRHLTGNLDWNQSDHAKVQQILYYFRDGMIKLLEDNDELNDDQRDLYELLEEHLGEYSQLHMWADEDDLEHLPSVYKYLEPVGKTAVKQDADWAVERTARLMIEIHVQWVEAEADSKRSADHPLMIIMLDGGKDEVENAFEHVLSFQQQETPASRAIKAVKQAVGAPIDDTPNEHYESIMKNTTALNYLNAYPRAVKDLRDAARERYERHKS